MSSPHQFRSWPWCIHYSISIPAWYKSQLFFSDVYHYCPCHCATSNTITCFTIPVALVNEQLDEENSTICRSSSNWLSRLVFHISVSLPQLHIFHYYIDEEKMWMISITNIYIYLYTPKSYQDVVLDQFFPDDSQYLPHRYNNSRYTSQLYQDEKIHNYINYYIAIIICLY